MATKKQKLAKHVTFCARTDRNIIQSGRQAELDTVQFLVDNLNTRQVGDYRILVNYNMPLRRGVSGALEVDVVVINKFGVFLLEVKDWRGTIEAYDGNWLANGKYSRGDALESINNKARILHGNIFGRGGEMPEWDQVSVTGLVVLARGTDRFINRSSKDTRLVVGLDSKLIRVLSSMTFTYRGSRGQGLKNLAIELVQEAIFGKYQAKTEELVGNYRILGELSPGDLFKSYEAQHVNITSRRVRVKRYELPNLSYETEKNRRHFQQSAEAVSKIGSPPNILNTLDCFWDPSRNHVFYEITELPTGKRLDEAMAHWRNPLSLEEQLDCVEPLCLALQHAHRHQVYHRNLNPETIFITQDGVVKLADFDFAKLVGEQTISQPGQVLVETNFTAPEIIFNPSSASAASDIYSLGMLWYVLACLPEQEPKFTNKRINSLKLPKAARQLMKSMVTKAPARRPQDIETVLRELQALRQSK